MQFQRTAIAGVFRVKAEPHADERGAFARLHCPDEFAAAGIPFAYYGATNSFASTVASAVIADWDAHPGKKFMLDPRFTRVGVGVAGPAANGRYRVTATYIRPKPAPAP